MLPQAQTLAGEVVGNYRILMPIGSGGMGVVYKAEHKHLGRPAAIKFLLPTLSSRPDVIARFFDEARAASLIEHPGIVQIFDCDFHATTGQAYIVMEFLEGTNLAQRLEERPGLAAQDQEWAVRVALQIAEPLVAAHAKGIVHRDLKPDNVFLVARGDGEAVKILDFGVAKLSQSLSPKGGNTVEGSLLGTPAYMAPEQCRGAIQADARSDVYALGCMLFQMLCGRTPFVGDNMTALISAHLCEMPPQVRSLAPAVSAALDTLVSAMLSKEPERRPASMKEVIRRLGECGNRTARTAVSPSGAGGTRVLPPTAEGRGERVRRGSAAAPHEPPPKPVAGRQRQTILAALGLLGAAAVAVAAGWALSRTSDRPGDQAAVPAQTAVPAQAAVPAASPERQNPPAAAPRGLEAAPDRGRSTDLPAEPSSASPARASANARETVEPTPGVPRRPSAEPVKVPRVRPGRPSTPRPQVEEHPPRNARLPIE
jgi:hypothetical protein